MISKKNNKVTQTLRITKDQKSEKLRIKLISVLAVKKRTKQPNKGRKIIVDNSIKKIKGLNKAQKSSKCKLIRGKAREGKTFCSIKGVWGFFQIL